MYVLRCDFAYEHIAKSIKVMAKFEDGCGLSKGARSRGEEGGEAPPILYAPGWCDPIARGFLVNVLSTSTPSMKHSVKT